MTGDIPIMSTVTELQDDGSYVTTEYEKDIVIVNKSVSGTFTAAGFSNSFSPEVGKEFNLNCAMSGAVAVIQLERKFTWSSRWFVVINDILRQSIPESFSLSESELSVQYRWNCISRTSGSPEYGLSQ